MSSQSQPGAVMSIHRKLTVPLAVFWKMNTMASTPSSAMTICFALTDRTDEPSRVDVGAFIEAIPLWSVVAV